jgi:HlyD family secretion protein
MEPNPEQQSSPLRQSTPPNPLATSSPFQSPTVEQSGEQDISNVSADSYSWSDLLVEPESRQKTGMRWLLGAGLLVIIGLGTWGITTTLRQRSPEPVAVSTLTLEPSSIERTIVESGTVVLGGQQTFIAPSDVTVQEVRVQERQRVSAGTVLLVLRDRSLQQELQTQLVNNQQAENWLARRREQVQEQQRKLDDALARLEESQALLERGFISEDEFRRDQDAVDQARSDLRDAEVELENQQLAVRNNQLITENLRAQLADTEITTPINAVILRIHVNPGDGIQQGGQLLTIGDPTQEAVRLQLSTLNARDVQVNMPVRVSVIGPDPQEFTGRIAYIAPQASADGTNDNSGETTSTVRARAILDRPTDELIPGSTVSVEIVLDQRQSVLTVPLTAIQNDGDAPYVWVRTADGTAARREIRLGLQNLQAAEILSGLEPGDEIVTSMPPDTNLAPATPLETQP